MDKITRRLFLRNTAAAGAVGTTIAAPAVAQAAEPMTPHEQAIWHIRELERLIIEDGGSRPTILIQAEYDPKDYRMIGIAIAGNFIDRDGMFRGGAS